MLQKYITRFAPNPGFMEQMGINWIWQRFETMTEIDCYNMLREIRSELDAP